MTKPGNVSTKHNPSGPDSHCVRGAQRLVYNRAGHSWTFSWDDASLGELITAINKLAGGPEVPLDSLDSLIITSILSQEMKSASGPNVLPPTTRAG